MLRKFLLLALAAPLLALGLTSKAQAWGAVHAGYTHVGPGGVYHQGYTAERGPYGGTSVQRSGGYAGYGGAGGYHAEYGHTGYGGSYGAAYGGYRSYTPSYSGGYAAGGYHYSGGYQAGVYRGW
jgi:hypothetical protein